MHNGLFIIAHAVLPKYTQTKSMLRKTIVTLSPREFSKRLSQCLDDTGAPAHARERAIILSKLLDIPKHLAWSLLEGQQLPDKELLQKIASEFEVEPQWLSGEN